MPNRKRKTLQPRVRDNVENGSRVCTDTYVGYDGLGDEYVHEMVDHFAKEYVRKGTIHVNGMENFWNLLNSIRRLPKSLCLTLINNQQSTINN